MGLAYGGPAMSGDHAEREVGVPADAGSDSSGDDALKNEADVGRQDFDQEKARLGEAKKGRSKYHWGLWQAGDQSRASS